MPRSGSTASIAHLLVPGSLRQALERTRAGLRAVDGDYLLGRFSYADIAMAVVLEGIAPMAQVDPPLGPATRRCWSDPALAEEFEDLLHWRQRLTACTLAGGTVSQRAEAAALSRRALHA